MGTNILIRVDVHNVPEEPQPSVCIVYTHYFALASSFILLFSCLRPCITTLSCCMHAWDLSLETRLRTGCAGSSKALRGSRHLQSEHRHIIWYFRCVGAAGAVLPLAERGDVYFVFFFSFFVVVAPETGRPVVWLSGHLGTTCWQLQYEIFTCFESRWGLGTFLGHNVCMGCE